MKIKALVPMWRRPEVVRVFLHFFETNKPNYAELDMCPVISEEDPHFDVLRDMVKDYDYLVFPNKHLGEKKNAGLKYMLGSDWDYLMDLGSDDIFSPLLWDFYRGHFGKDFFGLCNLYVYDAVNRKALFLRRYANFKGLESYGAGRMIRRDVCEKLQTLWHNDWDCGMDGYSRQKMLDNGYKETVIDSNRAFLMLDLKTNTNIHHIMLLNGEDVEPEIIENEFNLHGDYLEYPGVFTYFTFDGFHGEVCKRAEKLNKRDAFNQVNTEYRMVFGTGRYKNYDSYKTNVTKRYGKRNNSL